MRDTFLDSRNVENDFRYSERVCVDCDEPRIILNRYGPPVTCKQRNYLDALSGRSAVIVDDQGFDVWCTGPGGFDSNSLHWAIHRSAFVAMMSADETEKQEVEKVLGWLRWYERGLIISTLHYDVEEWLDFLDVHAGPGPDMFWSRGDNDWRHVPRPKGEQPYKNVIQLKRKTS